MERVKFYSISDMSTGINLQKTKKITDSFDKNKADYTISDIIEFYNIIKYIDSKCYLNYLLNWSESDIINILEVTRKYKAIVARYFKGITNENILIKYGEIEEDYFDYREDFFELIEKYKVYENISEEVFSNLIYMPKVFLEYVLYNKNTTFYYGNLIRKYFFEDSEFAEIILDKYEVKHINRDYNVYFPKELTLNDKEKIIINYINSESPNLNYLRIINTIQNREELAISDKTRLLSVKRTKEINDKYFSNSPGLEYGADVCFKKGQDEVIEFKREKHIYKYSYDLNWVYDNKDFNSLLNNFIYLFEYVDMQMRITLVSKKNELALTEKFMGLKSNREYETGISFNVNNMLSMLQIIAYYKELNKIDIRLEDIIEWFFHKYLLEEFNILDYTITMPSKDSTYVEKCKAILPEIDYILKEYNLYVEDGEIDKELLEVSSTPILFESAKSLIDKKYIYGNISKNEFNNLCHYFFSDQCMLHYTEKFGSKYNSFYKLITNENVTVDDYPEHSKRELEMLVKQDYIFINSSGYIKIKDNILLTIIMDLNYNEVISYWKYPKEYRAKIDELLESQILTSESSLFSKQEQDYFNFYLNQRSFNNSLDLRNKYLHGNKFKNDNEDTHYSNYLTFLRILVLIVIKINDELCMRDEKINKEKQ